MKMSEDSVLPVSLIIPTRNRKLKLIRLLDSINKLSSKPVEIIVVNDGSTDGTDVFASYWLHQHDFQTKKLINIPSSKGPANARNVGIKNASQNIVAFTDDDVVVSRHWIKRLIDKLLESSPSIAGVGGRVLPLQNDILSKYYAEMKLLDPPKNLQYIVTANSCFKKDILVKAGFFDTSFSSAGGEDTELCLRLRKMSYSFDIQPNAIVYHDYSHNFLDFCKTWIRYGKGTGKAIQKMRMLQ
jgi:glycosyltransferase involved in cell wall biosynthesis